MEKVIAFIPVRGGSKSIPLKNVKPFCGKPLVCWNIEALEACPIVDEIVVATDSDKIEDVVQSMQYCKTSVYRRSAKNASDTASTESVMLEFLESVNLEANTIFMLVQATSPLTQTTHFTEALTKYKEGLFDSMLTCVRCKRFFWTENGNSLNYDYKNRPRRQDFAGLMMENGAFYINTVKNILDYGNRLCGRIGIYEMPEYTSAEIDEPEDWMYLEEMMQRLILSKHKATHKPIKLFLSDVDGVLTDAGMYYSENGDELKKFNTHDGMGFKLLREAGIKTGIITSEDTQIVARRAKKLNVDFLYQGKREGGKLEVAKEVCSQMGISLEEVAYIGDDINCYDLLSAVGTAACPANSLPKIKALPGILHLSKRGGEGAVREFVEWILSNMTL